MVAVLLNKTLFENPLSTISSCFWIGRFNNNSFSIAGKKNIFLVLMPPWYYQISAFYLFSLAEMVTVYPLNEYQISNQWWFTKAIPISFYIRMFLFNVHVKEEENEIVGFITSPMHGLFNYSLYFSVDMFNRIWTDILGLIWF